MDTNYSLRNALKYAELADIIILLFIAQGVGNLQNFIFSLLILLSLNACQTHLPIISDDNALSSDISRKAACEQNIERIELADIDYLLYANKMIDSMIQSRNVRKKTANNRMRLYLPPVSHSDDVDMISLNTSIKNRVMRSGLFIVVNDQRQADYQLSGTFEKINKQANLCNENYEVFSLYLKDSRTDAILWSEHKQFY